MDIVLSAKSEDLQFRHSLTSRGIYPLRFLAPHLAANGRLELGRSKNTFRFSHRNYRRLIDGVLAPDLFAFDDLGF